tara:strand:+ start:323 stop:841 length:519 start_codon:yes stop_codon:yes gene_type:complete
MKKILIFLPFLIFLASCNTNEDTEFTIAYSEVFELPATFGIEYPTSTDLISIATESEDRFEENLTTSDRLNTARISNMQISLTGPTGSDLEFVDRINIFISANGLSEIKVASIDGATTNDVLLQADLEVIDVKEYLKLPTILFRVEYSSDGFSNQNRECVLNVRLTVDATKS